MPRYRTCVSVGERSPEDMRRVLMRALEESEYAEARLDYLGTTDQIAGLLESLPADSLSKRVVCTLRAGRDGGCFAGAEELRLGALRLIASYGPFLLDVEYDALVGNRPLARDLQSSDARMLVSWHSLVRMPGIGVMRKRLNAMSAYSPHIKIACMAKNTDEAVRMLELYGWLGAREGPEIRSLISFAMGDAGKFTRLLCMHLGSPYTYASLGRALAPGQFTLGEIKKIERLAGLAAAT